MRKQGAFQQNTIHDEPAAEQEWDGGEEVVEQRCR